MEWAGVEVSAQSGWRTPKCCLGISLLLGRLRWTILYASGKFQYPGSSRFDISRVLLEASSIPGPKYLRLPGPLSLSLFSPPSDTKKDLKQITSHLLDMLVSKKVSGQGRDQALNLLNKNVPRKDLSIHDNSRTIYVVDNGEEVGGPGLTPEFPWAPGYLALGRKWKKFSIPMEKPGKIISMLGSTNGLVKAEVKSLSYGPGHTQKMSKYTQQHLIWVKFPNKWGKC